MRTRKPYSLFKRKVGKKTIYYYSVFDENGEVKRYSTGCTSQSNALDEIARRIQQGTLVNRDTIKAPPSFGEYAAIWWTEDCEYVKAEKDSGRELSKGYLSIQRSSLERYLIPASAIEYAEENIMIG